MSDDGREAEPFEPTRLNRTGDPELLQLATRHMLKRWREEGAGPRYFKLNRRIQYRGVELNR